MNQQALLNDVSKYFTRFKDQVHILNSNSEFSINIHAENVLIKILNLIYGCDFENLNYTSKNYDSIDLGDKNGKMSIQVTATKNLEKIKETLEKYTQNKHYDIYSNVKILILGTRQEKYGMKTINKIIDNKYAFDQGTDIIDFSTLYQKLNQQNDISKILAVHELLRSQFTDIVSPVTNVDIFSNYEELKIWVCKKLKETNQLFKSYGPNSGAADTGPVRWDLTLWYEVRREKLVPLNSNISTTIKEHFTLIPSSNQRIFQKYLDHVYAFEKHCIDANFDYSQFLFPNEMSKEICYDYKSSNKVDQKSGANERSWIKRIYNWFNP